VLKCIILQKINGKKFFLFTNFLLNVNCTRYLLTHTFYNYFFFFNFVRFHVANMTTGRTNFGVGVLNEMIYAVGGNTGDLDRHSSTLASAEVFW